MLTCSSTDFNIAIVRHVLTIAVKDMGVLHYTIIPSQCIQVNIERLVFSLAVKLYNLQYNKVEKKKGDQFFYQMSDFCKLGVHE